MWLWRGLEKISWSDKMKNEEVLEGRVMGKRRQGQPRRGMISDLKEAIRDVKEEDSDSSKEEDNDPGERKKGAYVKMKRMAGNRKRWMEWVPETGLMAEDQ